jgi:hypothetical protein
MENPENQIFHCFSISAYPSRNILSADAGSTENLTPVVRPVNVTRNVLPVCDSTGPDKGSG